MEQVYLVPHELYSSNRIVQGSNVYIAKEKIIIFISLIDINKLGNEKIVF